MLNVYFSGIILFFILSFISWIFSNTSQIDEDDNNVIYSIISCIIISILWPLFIFITLFIMIIVNIEDKNHNI